MPRSWIVTALVNFFIAAFLGWLMRYTFLDPMDFNFRYLTHAHSHVAMLGWIYLMLFTLITYFFVPKKRKSYSYLFWITQLAVVGMLCSFPFQGYAAISISFSTLHIFCSYYFVRLVWKDMKPKSLPEKYLLKASLLFMLISTIGVWCLGPAVATLGNQSAFYNIAIQFFLHFQFNGWFLFAVFAVLFNLFRTSGMAINIRQFKLFFWLLISSTIFTMALPVSWFIPDPLFIGINIIGILLQIAAAIVFLKMMSSGWNSFWKGIPVLAKYMFYFAFVCLVMKIVLQSTSLLPEIAEITLQVRNFVIGFIHLLMLGVISGFLLAFLFQSSLVNLNSVFLKSGTILFLTGFIGTEILLFLQGAVFYWGSGNFPYYYLSIFIFSSLIVIGILFFILGFLKKKSANGVKVLLFIQGNGK